MGTDSYHLGIDLGTTYVAAGILRHGRPEIVTLGDRAPVVPSVLYFKEDGDILHGESATRRGLSDPTRMVREFKRRVGDATPMVVGRTPYSADVLLAKLLAFTHRAVIDGQGGRPASIAVTHPANWGSYKLDVLQQAVRMAEIGEITTLTEPVAAAIHYAATERLDRGQTVAVYDLGGGTFDAAVLSRTGTGVDFEVLGEVEGIERLGGIDFDEAVFHHAIRWAENALAELDVDEPAVLQALARLRQECVAAKEALSIDTDVSIPVVLPNLQTEIRLTRAEFEAMVRPLLQQTVEALRRAITSSGVSVDELAAVLLVGGSSRIPLIAEMVGAELGRPIAVDQHPKHTVALGAAIAAGRAAGAEVPGAGPGPGPAAEALPASASAAAAPGASTRSTEPEAADGPDRSQLISIRRDGDGPQAVISRVPDSVPTDNGVVAPAASLAPSATPTTAAPIAPTDPHPSRAPTPSQPPSQHHAPAPGPAPSQSPGHVPLVDPAPSLGDGHAASAAAGAGAAAPAPSAGLQAPPQIGGEAPPPFDHRGLLAGSRSPGGRNGVVLALVGLIVLALIGGAAFILTTGDGGTDLEAGDDPTLATVDPAGPDEAIDPSTTDPSDGDPSGDDPVDAQGDETATSLAPTTSSTATTSTTEPTTSTTAAPATGRAATITGITVDGSAYAVAYTTTFDPMIGGGPSSHHLHFFFDTVDITDAGQPGAGPWVLYDGPSPFRGYGPGDRPSAATRLCVTVATNDHAVDDPAVFHCAELPD